MGLDFERHFAHNDQVSMVENRWREVEQVMGELLELSPDKYCEYLENSEQPPEVRRRVGELLRAWQQSEGFLERPPMALAPVARDRLVGSHLGVWRIDSVIGYGGMGTVYSAERDNGDFAQHAAVKVVAAGRLSRAMERRFREERSILARLEHPHVARLIDGGVAPDGSPYLVMEHVEGMPVDVWLRERGADRRERLRVFLQVCEAVQFAHQNLVAHCDLKPANILVTRDGVPKLLDFGIARLLTPEREATDTLLHPMTLDYASPEQVRGETPGIASDIYSLGIVLHELMTGRRPYRLAGIPLDEVMATVCRKEAEKPGTGAPDLDVVILKAIEKDPRRRYGSVEQFARDVRLYLEGRPVSARPDSVFYRSGKFLRRRAVPLAAVSAAGAALLAGLFSTWVQSRRAERRFNEARSLAHAVLFDIYDSISGIPGSLPARRLVASRAQEYLDHLAGDAAADSGLIRDLGESYLRLGDVRGSPYTANLGDTAGALETFRKGQALLEKEAARRPNDLAVKNLLCQVHLRIARVMGRQGNVADETAVLRQAVAEAEALNEIRRDLDSMVLLSRAYSHSAEAQQLAAAAAGSREGFEEAVRTSLKSLEILEKDGPRGEEAWQDAVATRDERVAYALLALGDNTGDASYYRRALDYLLRVNTYNRRMISAQPGPRRERGLADGLTSVGQTRWKCCHDLEGATRDLREAIGMFQRLVDADPHNLEALRDLGNAWNGMGMVMAGAGGRPEALAANRKALSILQDLARVDPESDENAASLKEVRERIERIGR